MVDIRLLEGLEDIKKRLGAIEDKLNVGNGPMWAELYCTKCGRIVRLISSGTTTLQINIKNMAEAKTSICPNCGTVEYVEVRANVMSED